MLKSDNRNAQQPNSTEGEPTLPSRRDFGINLLRAAVGLTTLASVTPGRSDEPDFGATRRIETSCLEAFSGMQRAVSGADKTVTTAFCTELGNRAGEILASKDTAAQLCTKLDTASINVLKGALKLADGATLVKAEVSLEQGRPELSLEISSGGTTSNHQVRDAELVRAVSANEYLKEISKHRQYPNYVREMVARHIEEIPQP